MTFVRDACSLTLRRVYGTAQLEMRSRRRAVYNRDGFRRGLAVNRHAMKLSVVMPVYNERATLREVVGKVLSVPLEIELITLPFKL